MGDVIYGWSLILVKQFHLRHICRYSYFFFKILIIFTAEKLKREFDNRFGAPWHVIVGEAYSFNIDYDFHFLYYFLYGPIAILVWRVSIFCFKYFFDIYFLQMFHLGLILGFGKWEFDFIFVSSQYHIYPQNLLKILEYL